MDQWCYITFQGPQASQKNLWVILVHAWMVKDIEKCTDVLGFLGEGWNARVSWMFLCPGMLTGSHPVPSDNRGTSTIENGQQPFAGYIMLPYILYILYIYIYLNIYIYIIHYTHQYYIHLSHIFMVRSWYSSDWALPCLPQPTWNFRFSISRCLRASLASAPPPCPAPHLLQAQHRPLEPMKPYARRLDAACMKLLLRDATCNTPFQICDACLDMS